MGVSYTAYTVLGLRLENRELWRKATLHGCKHEHGGKFCPTCGKPAEVVEEVPVIEGWEDMKADGEIDGLRIATGTDGDPVYVGIVSRQSDYSKPEEAFIKFDDIQGIVAASQKVREVFEPHGLWKPERFGIHTVLHCSY